MEHARLSILKNGKPLASIILENIAKATSTEKYNQDSELFWHPNVIDIKLGKILASESEESEKMKRKEGTARSTTSGTFAMRLTGAQVRFLPRCLFSLMPTALRRVSSEGHKLRNYPICLRK